MFSSAQLFKNVACPDREKCVLTNCIFSHDPEVTAVIAPEAIASNRTDPGEVIEQSLRDGNDRKRQKLDDGSAVVKQSLEPSISRKKDTFVGLLTDEKLDPSSTIPARQGPINKSRSTNANQVKVKTTSRPISPPPVPSRETLNPRMVPSAPAQHGLRMTYLKALLEAVKELNQEVSRDEDPKVRSLSMTESELIRYVMDEEERLARENPSIYGNQIKLQIVKAKRMSVTEWVQTRTQSNKPEEHKPEKPTTKSLDTGLTPTQELFMVKGLVTPREGLVAGGYIMEAPSQEDIAAAQEADLVSPWRTCDRCGTHFQVFPERREDGALTSGGACTHHWGKLIHPQKKKTDHIEGHKEPLFSCCQTASGSTGCTTAPTHVFKKSGPKGLAAVLPFEATPPNPNAGPQDPVCFDCEMAYTCYGLELIRVTAVTWPQGALLLDVLVRPLGQILDFNSRFSGVFPDHFLNAEEFDISAWVAKRAAERDTDVSSDQNTEESLKIVASPAVARSVLTSMISPDTPLIGHGLENDLNAIRLIHPTIVDTVFLFPHPRGLPYRNALRNLTSQHLGRSIQVAGAAGHDSLEDAKATGDLVRFKVKKDWSWMQQKGWTLEDGQFIQPDGNIAEDLPSRLKDYWMSKLKKGKRKIAQTDGCEDTSESESSAE
ncbi:hypothetical protein NA57DRAFT_63573 [Rhizodiscina lignyota]|uniref:Exonuclease domain-containing protein n=1 Tax=Rhizodiscina lignyota TaxID=1504668 RepID=A0A9P4IJJ3_9PEZI|nr:hypothetical protein NA57DRAFT_63573 [Rhizodiscina lignyota]